MLVRSRAVPWLSLFTIGLLANAADAVNIDMVTVGNPGNAGDARYTDPPYSPPSYGAVSYAYQIGKFEVTAGQYTAFLNAVAASDPYGLYNTSMAQPSDFAWGCNIQRSGSSGSYTYSVASDWANRPVNYVSWGDAVRFVNWLANGQPTGAQDLTTTEDGSYYLNGAVTDAALMAVTRRPDATWVLPTEDEWYKAAYYDPAKEGGAGYWDYPTRSNALPSNVFDPRGTSNVNFYNYEKGATIGAPYYRTEVGAFAASPGPYGTFDQGGNVWEWNETHVSGYGHIGLRGGSFGSDGFDLTAVSRRDSGYPTFEQTGFGFRVAEIPEPCTILLGIAALTCASRRLRQLRVAR